MVRLTRFIPDWCIFINKYIQKIIFDQFVCLKVKYPDDEDLDGAAIGLLRLQETYKLPTKQLADGFVGNENVGKELTAHDCFEIGRSAYNQKVLKKKWNKLFLI